MIILERLVAVIIAVPVVVTGAPLAAQDVCVGYGPQTPRDIREATGSNPVIISTAPPADEMNLCDIHLHAQAEHQGPGFSVADPDGVGFRCDGTDALTEAELAPMGGAFEDVVPGDTIEVHWVHTSCDIPPGPGLGSCLSESCANPQLRVETQVFLVVNDPGAMNFLDMTLDDAARGRPRAKAIPGDTGEPVVFAGSTTGPSYSERRCSPLGVTWSVRPQCARLHIGSLHAWADGGNVFEETTPHGVRPLVTAPELLARIE